jgi:hypothetical protein
MTSSTLFRVASMAGAALLTAGLARPAAAADVSQTRNVPRFDHIRVRGAFATTITAGAPGIHVVVTAAPDQVDRVSTTVEGGTLVVEMRNGNWNLNGPLHLTIDLPTLRGFSEEGAGTTSISGLHGGDVDLTCAGAGTLRASGHARALTIELDGAGKIDTLGVDARDVVVTNNGVGSARVRASETLDASINGVGEIRYAGTATVKSQINGIGSIHRL